MTISDLGSIGEFVGAIAVLITLLYLAKQIRQTGVATRAQIRQSLADRQVQYIGLRASDPFIRRATARMFAGEPLDPDEGFGLQMHLIAGMRLFENYFAQYAIGTMDPKDWRAMREVIKRHLSYPQARMAVLGVESAWNSDFVAEIKGIIEEIDLGTT